MLHTVVRGDGPQTVLLVHGFLGTSRNLLSLARRLSEAEPSWRIVLPDLRGHGLSPKLEPQDDLAELADDLAAVVSQSGATPAMLIGHSLGGRVALAAIDRHPTLFSYCALLDIAPGPLPSLTGPMQRVFERLMGAPPTAPTRADMRQFFLAGGVDAGLADWVLTNLDVSGDGHVLWRIDRAGLASLHWHEGTADLWDAAERVASKLFCLSGELSGFVPPEQAARLAALGATTQVIAKAGHFLHVDALSETVTALLSQLPKRA